MKKYMLLLVVFLSLVSGFSHSAIINYTMHGLVTSTDIVDTDGALVTGRVASITFEYDSILATSNMNYMDVDIPISMSISVAGMDVSVTSTNTLFESWNDSSIDAVTCSDSFNGIGWGVFSFFFEATTHRQEGTGCGASNSPDLLTASVTAPDGTFVYDRGSVSINGFGQMQVEYVPLPAAVWLFSSGLIGMLGIARRNKKLEVPV